MLLSGTKAQVDGKTFDVKIGVQQGGVISPQLFTLFINDLLDKLSTNDKHFWTEAYAFADDVVIITEGRLAVHRAINTLK